MTIVSSRARWRGGFWVGSCLGLGLLGGVLTAGERFPFVIPGDDAAPSFTDFTPLNRRPAGADGFVRIQEGHFATDAGRLRFWGVNLCFGANFPTHAEAEKVAAHLAKLGVNAVRLHHHDTAPAPRGVLGPVQNGRRSLDPEQLDRQDYFLDQLHRHGIYANLNLHVGRTFTEAEGFVAKGLPRAARYDKYLLYFEPRMRARFKEFCRAYLGHENPYRHRRRADDPGVAMIELTNENAFSQRGPDLAAGLPEPYRGEFKRQWNRWLARHYPDTAALERAWRRGDEPPGPVLLETSAWRDGPGGWWLNQRKGYPVKLHFGEPGPTPDQPALRVEIARPATAAHYQELLHSDLELQPGRVYTLRFWIKAARPRSLFVDVSNQGPGNWRSVGFQEILSLTTRWQEVKRVFRAAPTIPGKVRVCFKFGDDDGDFWLAGLRLQAGGTWAGPAPDQTLEAGNLEIPVRGWSEAARADARRFMVDTEEAFIRDLTAFLKRDLGVRVPITASQITYHGAAIVAHTCDYADIHAYWQHPHFPRRPWDATDWTIPNTPMEAAPGEDSLLKCATWRLLDRPFTLSEWNIPAPNDYAASVVPFAALVAGLQDWDGVFFFDYQSNPRGWFSDRLQGYFSFNGHPVKVALLAACANLYRRGDLAPLAEVAAGTLTERLPTTLALRYRIGMDPRAGAPAPIKAPRGKRLASPDGRVVWDATDPKRAFVSVVTPKTVAAWGLLGGRELDLGGIHVAVGAAERDYAVVVLTSRDDRPIAQSRRLLLTAVGAAENPGMRWNADRTSIGPHWGSGPARVNGIPVTLTLPGRTTRVWALDGRGRPRAAVPVQAANAGVRVRVGPRWRTLWYGLERD